MRLARAATGSPAQPNDSHTACRAPLVQRLSGRWRIALWLVVALGGLWPSDSHAQPDTGWLRVRGQDSCLRAPVLAARAERHLRDGSPATGITIELDATGPTLRFTVSRAGQPIATRTFARMGSSCQARLDALGLAMALAIESAGAGKVVMPEPGSAAPGADAPEAAPAPEAGAAGGAGHTSSATPSDREGADATPGDREGADATLGHRGGADATPGHRGGADATPSGRLALFLSGGVILNAQPAPALALGGGMELRRGAFSVALAALWSPEVASTPADRVSGQAHTTLFGGQASACLGQRVGVLRSEGCVSVFAGAISASGDGFERDQQDTIPWLATALGIRARLPASGPLALGARIDVTQNLIQPALRVTGGGGGLERVGLIGLLAAIELHCWLP